MTGFRLSHPGIINDPIVRSGRDGRITSYNRNRSVTHQRQKFSPRTFIRSRYILINFLPCVFSSSDIAGKLKFKRKIIYYPNSPLIQSPSVYTLEGMLSLTEIETTLRGRKRRVECLTQIQTESRVEKRREKKKKEKKKEKAGYSRGLAKSWNSVAQELMSEAVIE